MSATSPLVIVLALEAFALYVGQRLIFGRAFALLGKLPAYFLAAPGTILHELSHLLACKLLGVQTGEVSLFRPRQGEDGSFTLGYVKHAESDPLRGALVAIAPLLLVPPLLLGTTALLLGSSAITDLPSALTGAPFWKSALWLYIALSAGQGAFPSTGDRVGVLGFIALAGLGALLVLIVPTSQWEGVVRTLAVLLAPPALAATLSLLALRWLGRRGRRG